MLTTIVAFVLAAVNFAALIYINSVKNNAQADIFILEQKGNAVEPKEFYEIQLWSLVSAVSIIFINEVGKLALTYFVEEEAYATTSLLLTEKVLVISIFKFVNTAIVPMAASFFGVSNFEAQFTAGGLVDDISAVLVYYALIH